MHIPASVVTEAQTPDTALAPKIVGAWYGTGGGNVTTYGPVQDAWYLSPFWVPEAISIDALGTSVVVLTAGGTPRLAIYKITAWPTVAAPSAFAALLLQDAGTVDATTTGVKTATFSPIPIPAGTWVGLLLSGQGTNGYTISAPRADNVSQAQHIGPLGMGDAGANQPVNLVIRINSASFSGAAPAAINSGSSPPNEVSRVGSGVYMRRSA